MATRSGRFYHVGRWVSGGNRTDSATESAALVRDFTHFLADFASRRVSQGSGGCLRVLLLLGPDTRCQASWCPGDRSASTPWGLAHVLPALRGPRTPEPRFWATRATGETRRASAILVNSMQRRTLSRRSLLASSVCALVSCRSGGAREQVLRALVEQVVVPNTAAVAESSRRLATEAGRFAAEPTVSALHAVRQQWRNALSSWKRADAFRNGPIMDTNSLLRAMFWPVRTGALEALVQGSEAIDEPSVELMGVDRRGLFALEYLLFSEGELERADERILTGFVGPMGERRGRLARCLAVNVSLHADRAARSLGDGKRYADQFADRGQDSLNHLVGQLVSTVENGSENRLARISSLAKSGRLKAADVEGSRGRMSQQIALTYLRATEQLYLGVDRGLGQLVKDLSPTVDGGIRSDFARAIAAVSNLAMPLEEAVKRDASALDDAAVAVKKLERALKTELVSTLGVTLTFSSADGD